MHTALDCIPCFARQALEAARFVTDDERIQRRVVRHVLRLAAEMDMSLSPPVVAQQVHRHLRRLSGVADPYRQVKDRFNTMALDMWDALCADVQQAADPLERALRLAIAGNVIDFGIRGDLTEADVLSTIARTTNQPLCGDVGAFRREVESAGEILYLADNAGEIVFDRLLIEQMPTDRVTVAVRGGPILNDVTRADADAVGLTGLVEVIDNGSDAPGTLLADCSEAFRRRFARVDLVIAKGQGNFETLSDTEANLYFLFQAKCPVIAGHVGLPVGSQIALPGGRAAARSACGGQAVASERRVP